MTAVLDPCAGKVSMTSASSTEISSASSTSAVTVTAKQMLLTVSRLLGTDLDSVRARLADGIVLSELLDHSGISPKTFVAALREQGPA